GDPAAAHKDVERIAALRDELKAAKNEYWANEVEVMRLASLTCIALAQKKTDEALGLMRQAADIEDRSEKNIVTPGRLLPARELLGDMLMELKRPAEALKEYEASQLREPNRYRGLYGAGQAAEQSGNRDQARHYFSKLIELAGSADFRPDKEKAAKFYEETFGFERVSQSRVATRLSDGVMNITLLQFETEEDAGDERGKDFVGLHHFGIWVDDIDTMKQSIEAHGGKYHPG